MAHFLDDLPLDFSKPGIQDLLAVLSENFYSARLAAPLIQKAGISLGLINLDQPMALAWPQILDEARRKSMLRTLLTVITESADTAIAVRVAEIMAASPVQPAVAASNFSSPKITLDTEDGLERQLESEPTLLDIAFLERGVELAPSVVRLLVTLSDGEYYGTGFRIGDDLLLTNHHVLFDSKGPASQVEAWFGYEKSFEGADRAHVAVPCNPTTILGEAKHDWAVIRTATQMPESAEVIPLIGAPVPQPLDRVYVIQHPHGGVKKIGMIHNVVVAVTEDLLQYHVDTEGGSSGSPVFNERWQVVGLHHQWGKRNRGSEIEYYNQGQRIERVVAGLAKHGLM